MRSPSRGRARGVSWDRAGGGGWGIRAVGQLTTPDAPTQAVSGRVHTVRYRIPRWDGCGPCRTRWIPYPPVSCGIMVDCRRQIGPECPHRPPPVAVAQPPRYLPQPLRWMCLSSEPSRRPGWLVRVRWEEPRVSVGELSGSGVIFGAIPLPSHPVTKVISPSLARNMLRILTIQECLIGGFR